MARLRWGKVRDQEDYEDTARVARFDALIAERAKAVSGPVRE
jgi:hypothetical protein